jgi:hypothetical protein
VNPRFLLERTIEVHRRLLQAGIDNAIGGALALAYYVDEPRGTLDIDINVSVSADRARDVLELLPADVPWDESTIATIESQDQVRIMWPVEGFVPVPLDLFFMVDDLHEVVRQRAVTVPMLDTHIAIVSATDLTIFKALFDRPKDWVDIASMVDAHDSTVDLDEAVGWVGRIVGWDDDRVVRLRALVPPTGRSTSDPAPPPGP